MRRKWMLGLLSAVLVIAPTAALAEEPTTTTSTESSSGAVAVNVADAVVVSQTSASNDGTADATVVAVFGETVVGGSQSGEGADQGELLSTGDAGVGSASVGSWSAEADGNGSSRSSSSVAHVNVGGDSGGDIRLLGSDSQADGQGSRASTYGAHLSGQGHEMYILRSSADTAGSATTAVLDIDGNVLFSNEDVQAVCALAPSGLLSLACTYAEITTVDQDGDGVPDGTQATAGVVDGVVVDTFGLDLVQAGGVVPSGDTVTPGVNPPSQPPASPPPGDGGQLPISGAPVAALLGAALGALGLGDRLRRFGG